MAIHASSGETNAELRARRFAGGADSDLVGMGAGALDQGEGDMGGVGQGELRLSSVDLACPHTGGGPRRLVPTPRLGDAHNPQG